MGYTWLKSDGTIIDGGSKIDLGINTITFGFNTHSPSPPVVPNNGPHEVDLVGNTNAVIKIKGNYKMQRLINSAGSVSITQARIGSFMDIGSIVWFGDDEFDGSHRPGSWFGGSIAVIPISFAANRSIQSQEGSQLINYSLGLTETKEF